MIVTAVYRALAQLGDPRFRRVIWFGLALAVALLFAMYAAVLLVVQVFTPDSIALPWVGEVTGLSTLLSVGSIAVMLVLSVFLMVPVASAFTGLFLDDVADAVEARYYPGLPETPRTPFWPAMLDSLRYFGVLVALNLVGLVVVIFSAGLGVVVLWAINGYLLSREYFTMVAIRRMAPEDAHAMRRANPVRLWIAGVLMAIPLSVPLVNLLVPVIGAAVFTHLFHHIAMR